MNLADINAHFDKVARLHAQATDSSQPELAKAATNALVQELASVEPSNAYKALRERVFSEVKAFISTPDVTERMLDYATLSRSEQLRLLQDINDFIAESYRQEMLAFDPSFNRPLTAARIEEKNNPNPNADWGGTNFWPYESDCRLDRTYMNFMKDDPDLNNPKYRPMATLADEGGNTATHEQDHHIRQNLNRWMLASVDDDNVPLSLEKSPVLTPDHPLYEDALYQKIMRDRNLWIAKPQLAYDAQLDERLSKQFGRAVGAFIKSHLAMQPRVPAMPFLPAHTPPANPFGLAA